MTKKDKRKNVIATRFGWTWTCPYCGTVNFTKQSLVSTGEYRACINPYCGGGSRVFPDKFPEGFKNDRKK